MSFFDNVVSSVIFPEYFRATCAIDLTQEYIDRLNFLKNISLGRLKTNAENVFKFCVQGARDLEDLRLLAHALFGGNYRQSIFKNNKFLPIIKHLFKANADVVTMQQIFLAWYENFRANYETQSERENRELLYQNLCEADRIIYFASLNEEKQTVADYLEIDGNTLLNFCFGGGKLYLDAFLRGIHPGYRGDTECMGIYVNFGTDFVYGSETEFYAEWQSVDHFDIPCVFTGNIAAQYLLICVDGEGGDPEACLPSTSIPYIENHRIETREFYKNAFSNFSALFPDRLKILRNTTCERKVATILSSHSQERENVGTFYTRSYGGYL